MAFGSTEKLGTLARTYPRCNELVKFALPSLSILIVIASQRQQIGCVQVMPKLRHLLLPFTSQPPSDAFSKPPDPSNHRSGIPSKPPLQLPTELWDPILDLLGTFALKKFRLVCPQWCVLGAERLYSTVYLNPYECSWSGLISISTSQHASLVKKIVWNPLELPEECLDAEIWASRYQNLLRGLKHRQIVHFHEAFAKVYGDRKSFLRSSKVELIPGAMNNLPNCHEIVLSDDYDLEASCKDSYFRAGIQKNSDLPKKPTTWGLRPQMWERTEEGYNCLLAVEDILKALRGCHFITCLKIDFWAAHWNPIHEAIKYEYIAHPLPRRSINTMLKYPHISELEFRVRFCELRWLWMEEPTIQSTLEYVIRCTDSFPDLQDLFFAPPFLEPERAYVEFFRLGSESIADDGVNLDAPVHPGITASEVLTKYALTQGLTDTVLNCLYAELPATALPLPKLRTLRFSNLTLDMRLLLFWLASHKQLPSSSISIHLLETTVLYGVDPALFLEALAQLNVRISYDRHNTFHCPLDSKLTRHIRIPNLEFSLINRRKVTHLRCWSKHALYSTGIGQVLELFPQFHGKAKQRCAEFIHRPDEFKPFVIDYAQNEYLTRQVIFYSYGISLDEHKNGTWEWVRLRTYRATYPEEQKRTAALVTLQLNSKSPYHEEQYETESDVVNDEISATEGLMLDAQNRREIEDQELLRQYETEFLGLDLIEEETMR